MSRTEKEKKAVLKKPIAKYNDYLAPDQLAGKKVMQDSTITIVTGKAGSGKSHLCTLFAAEQVAMGKKRGGFSKIVLIRPIAFDKTQDLGFIPGTIDEKFSAWTKPITDIIRDVEGNEKADEMMKGGSKRIVEVVPLQMIQGLTLSNSIVIVDEFENMTKDQIKSVFTRLGKTSKIVFNGDQSQCLLEKKSDSGLPRLIEMVGLVEGVSHVHLTTNHRNEIIEELLEKYD